WRFLRRQLCAGVAARDTRGEQDTDDAVACRYPVEHVVRSNACVEQPRFHLPREVVRRYVVGKSGTFVCASSYIGRAWRPAIASPDFMAPCPHHEALHAFPA